MNLNNFTIKSQETVQHAFETAQTYEHQSVEAGHIYKSLVVKASDVLSFILNKIGVNEFLFWLAFWVLAALAIIFLNK